MSCIGYPCSTIQGSSQYLSLMRPGPVSIASLDQVNNPCSTTIQGSVGYLFLMRPVVVLLPCWVSNHYLMPGLNVVIKGSSIYDVHKIFGVLTPSPCPHAST